MNVDDKNDDYSDFDNHCGKTYRNEHCVDIVESGNCSKHDALASY